MKPKKILDVASWIFLILSFVRTSFLGKGTHRGRHRSSKLSKYIGSETKGAVFPVNLPDANGDGQTDFDEFVRSFQGTGMSQREIHFLFNFIDKNHDSKISIEEWESFSNLFVSPFLSKCSDGRSPFIGSADLQRCLSAVEFTTFNRLKRPPQAVEILAAFDRETEGKFNFADYVFLRKVHLAWKDCSIDNVLNQERLECALHITEGKRFPVARRLFQIGQLINHGVVDNNNFVDINIFIFIARVYHYFWSFDPADGQNLSYKELLWGIRDLVLPLNITENTIKMLFDSIDSTHNRSESIDFSNFAAFYGLIKMFTKFSTRSQGFLQMDEFLSLLGHKAFNKVILSAIDHNIIVKEEDMKAILQTKQKVLATEEDFIINFLQISKKGRIAKKLLLSVSAENIYSDMRRITYGIFSPLRTDENTKDQVEAMDFQDFITFMKVSWCFVAFDSNGDGYLSNEEVSKGPENYNPPIRINRKEIRKWKELAEFPPEDSFNIKEIFAYFYYNKVFKNLIVPGTLHQIISATLINGLNKLGFIATSYVLDLSREPSVFVNGTVHDYEKAFSTAMNDEMLLIRNKRLNITGSDFTKNKNGFVDLNSHSNDLDSADRYTTIGF